MQKSLINAKKKDVSVIKDDKYTAKINIPQYKPSNICPKIYELTDTTKYRDLMKRINKANVPEDVKEFLKLGATRHIVFNYAKIADYYAHADKEVQKLIEESAMVIIDFDDALANGYVRLSKNIDAIMKETGVQA